MFIYQRVLHGSPSLLLGDFEPFPGFLSSGFQERTKAPDDDWPVYGHESVRSQGIGFAG